MKETLAREFNELVRKVRLARPDLLSPKVELSDATQLLKELNPSHGESLMRLNSLILNDVFPAHIVTDQTCLRPWPCDIVGVRDQERENARICSRACLGGRAHASGTVRLRSVRMTPLQHSATIIFPTSHFCPTRHFLFPVG